MLIMPILCSLCIWLGSVKTRSFGHCLSLKREGTNLQRRLWRILNVEQPVSAHCTFIVLTQLDGICLAVLISGMKLCGTK